jgi:hypothetical protein
MAEQVDNLVLEHLRALRSDMRDVKESLRFLTIRFSAMEGHLAAQHVSEVGQNTEIDRIKERLDRVERRLELVD